MQMKDVGGLFETYGADFFNWFFGFLTRPFSVREPYANSKHLLYLVFCALIGATIGSLIPGRPPLSDRATTAVTVVVVWTLTSVMIHFVSRLLGGQGSLEGTVLAMLQVLAVAYVTSNSVTMLVAMAEVMVPSIRDALSTTFLDTPGNLILFLQFCMVAIYTPMVLNTVHRFGRGLFVESIVGGGVIVGTIVGLLAALIAVAIASPVVSARGC